MTARNFGSEILFFLLLIAGLNFFSGCKAVENAVERGIKQATESLEEEGTTLETLTDQLSEAAVRAAMETLADDSLNQEIRYDLEILLDSLLGQFSDSLHNSSEVLVQDLFGRQTDSLLQARIIGMGLSLQDVYSRLAPEIRKSLNQIIQQDLNAGLRQLVQNLQQDLNSPETYANLDLLRIELTRQIDSLLRSSILATATYADDYIIPRVDDVANTVDGISTDTQKKASNLVWLIGAAGAALLFLAGLIRLYLQQQKYKEMVKVFTSKINSIDQQTVYDKLVGRITMEMKNKDLEESLRDILDEQDLIDQPEWDDMDHQVSRLILAQLKEPAEGKPVDQETWTKSLFEKAKKLGLEDHLISVLKRDSE